MTDRIASALARVAVHVQPIHYSIRDARDGAVVLAANFADRHAETAIRASLFFAAADLSARGVRVTVDVYADGIVAHPSKGLDQADLADVLASTAADVWPDANFRRS